MGNHIIEVCLDSVESALRAQQGGAHRVELCDNLFEGGTTPSIGCVREAKKRLTISLHVIIRPRGGDFFYSDIEYDVMKEDISALKDEGVDGVVIGLLNQDGTVDVKRTAELVSLAEPMSVTFHRAFDMTPDASAALEDVIQTGCSRILTSGQEESVLEGSELIRDLVTASANRIIIMPGGGITERNILRVKELTKANEFHVFAPKTEKSRMTFMPEHIYMGGVLRHHEDVLFYTDPDIISKVVKC